MPVQKAEPASVDEQELAAPVKGQPATAAQGAPVVGPQGAADDAKIARTFLMGRTLVKSAETAVLRTGGLPGGYKSMVALVNGAVARELERLANEYNGGDPFPPNTDTFRVGRPLG